MHNLLKMAWIGSALAAGLLMGQAQPAKAPVKPTVRPARVTPVSPLDTLIELVKSGMSEALITDVIRRDGKVYQLSPANVLALRNAGASEKVIGAMLNPTAPPAPIPATELPVSTQPPTPKGSTPVSSNGGWRRLGESVAGPVAGAAVTPAVRKRRLALYPFEYSTVRHWVLHWFNGDVNIGQGIRAMMVVRVAKSKNITLVEREKLNRLLQEQDLGGSDRVDQGTKARRGRLRGADAILEGDIVMFGRDDTRKGIGGNIPGIGGIWDRIGQVMKEEKAVVGINYRIVDAETGEIIDTGQARGESSRKSRDWGAIVAKNGNVATGKYDMTSSNFEATIIGEATSNAVDELVRQLDENIGSLPLKQLDIEGRVSLSGSRIHLVVGSNDGVQVGDQFEIHQIVSEIIDPETKAIHGKETVKVGEFVVSAVQPQFSSGSYTGQALIPTYEKGYLARKMN